MVITHEQFGIYEIEVDENQFTVRTPTTTTSDKEGKIIQLYKNFGFFSNLENAIHKIIKLRLLENPEKSIDLQVYIDRYKTTVEALKPFA